MDFYHKRVNDPVHGTICLSEVEKDIISSQAFQRLHNVKQLGLGVLVYPGANYSRFSHSLGACHLASKMVDAINQNSPEKVISDEQKTIYRLGGLLHDIGHYPFSHSFEHAGKSFYDSGEDYIEGKTSKGTFLNHEELGAFIIENDPEISSILKNHGIDVEALRRVFTITDPQYVSSILSSDLDCDRLDYLMRTAHHAGLPYGNIDTDYLINSMALDNANDLCLLPRAVNAADHMLISRYFDYQQAVFHKTIASLEWSLETILKSLFEKEIIPANSDDVTAIISEQGWNTYDDQFISERIRSAYFDKADAKLKEHLEAFIYRRPAKLLYEERAIKQDSDKEAYMKSKRFLESVVEAVMKDYDIPDHNWCVWGAPFKLTKMGGQISISDGNDYNEEKAQLVKIKTPCGSSKPLTNIKGTLIEGLSNSMKFELRVYAFLNEGVCRKAVSDKINSEFNKKS